MFSSEVTSFEEAFPRLCSQYPRHGKHGYFISKSHSDYSSGHKFTVAQIRHFLSRRDDSLDPMMVRTRSGHCVTQITLVNFFISTASFAQSAFFAQFVQFAQFTQTTLTTLTNQNTQTIFQLAFPNMLSTCKFVNL